jgi:hypothetical protein
MPFVEIEIRLGTLGKTFDSSVSKEYFETILTELKGFKEWTSVSTSDSVEYIQENIKNINGKKLVLKEKIMNKTVQMPTSPFDVRLSISQEFCLDSCIDTFSKVDCITRTKHRTSFIDKGYKYELTHVVEKKNNINKDKYEIEIELIIADILDWSLKYMNEFLECKVYDLVNLVEPIDRKEFTLFK